MDTPVASADGQQGRIVTLDPLAVPSPLKGALVSLREVCEQDVAAIAWLLADPRVTIHQLRPPPRSREAILRWIRLMEGRRRVGTLLNFAITISDDAELAGLCQLSVPPCGTHLEWGWVLAPRHWGSGAFEDVIAILKRLARDRFHVEEVTALVHPANHRSAEALKKIGSTLRSSSRSVTVWTTSTTE